MKIRPSFVPIICAGGYDDETNTTQLFWSALRSRIRAALQRCSNMRVDRQDDEAVGFVGRCDTEIWWHPMFTDKCRRLQ